MANSKRWHHFVHSDGIAYVDGVVADGTAEHYGYKWDDEFVLRRVRDGEIVQGPGGLAGFWEQEE